MSTCELLTCELSGPVDALFTKIVAECYTGPRFSFSLLIGFIFISGFI